LHKTGAAAPRHARAAIVVEFDDQIVEPIVSPQAIAGFAGAAPDRPIVAAIGGVFAPGIIRADWTRGKESSRMKAPIGAPPQPPKPESAARRCAVAFTFVGADARPPERDRQRKLPGDQDAPRF
jgi:hypothetical protein